MKKNISYFSLFLTFLKTGTISFGGYMMLISMIRYEFSIRKKIIKKKKIIDAITMASFLPGPMAINVASYIGFILKFLPNSKFINIVSNPIDNCWSIYKNHF